VQIIDRPSENHGPRRGGVRPTLVVLHYTAMETADSALDRLCAPGLEVSAHWLIAADGRVFRLVDEGRRAWHAGAVAWGAVDDVNSASIGIELDNRGDHPFAAAQMAVLEAVLRDVLGRWSIPPHGVIAHSDLAPARKVDPGPRFDWRRLARAGLAVWPTADAIGEASAPDLDRFIAATARIGYHGPPDAVLAAFRLRFRPWAAGRPLESGDVAAAEDLAAWFPEPGRDHRA